MLDIRLKTNIVDTNIVIGDQFPWLYYFISLKNYSKTKNTQKSISTVIYFYKIISASYKNHVNKPLAMILPSDSVLPIVKLSVKSFTKTLKCKQV